MYKTVPGNDLYKISISGDIRNNQGREPDLKTTPDGKIEIELYGKKVIVDLLWLGLIAHFEINLPEPSAEKLQRINFVNNNINLTNTISGKVMVFKKPELIVCDNKVYRIIPNFPRYAVTKEGEIINICTKNPVKVAFNIRKDRASGIYPSAFIYDPEHCCYKYVYIHRIVALAWVPNNDYVLRPIVNHLNGDKTCYHYRNLEWASYSENSFHAVNNGLRIDNFRCKIRDFRTGDVLEFASMSQAAAFMGLKSQRLLLTKDYLIKGRLVANKYEVKAADDNTPWFYEGKKEKVKLGRYIILVKYPDGNYKYYHDLKEFKSEFKIWNCANIDDIINNARFTYSELNFTYYDHWNHGKVQALNIETKEVVLGESIADISRKLNIPENRVRSCLHRPERKVCDGYVFRYNSSDEWNNIFGKYGVVKFEVNAKNPNTGESRVFDSLRKTAKFFKCDRSKIKNACINGDLIDGWVLSSEKLLQQMV